jgi:hypothetical protein
MRLRFRLRLPNRWFILYIAIFLKLHFYAAPAPQHRFISTVVAGQGEFSNAYLNKNVLIDSFYNTMSWILPNDLVKNMSLETCGGQETNN